MIAWRRDSAVVVPTERTLSRLYLMLFLRGRGARGSTKNATPKTVGRKLAFVVGFDAVFGLAALAFVGQPVLALATYLHSMTFILVGMFVATSAGEMLFNKEEADILLHRPIEPRALLRAKVSILVRVSLWLGGAVNLAGFVVGIFARDANWMFPVVHAASTALAALFCTGAIVLGYQLCLRWFGRERLDGLMTTVQVLVSIGFFLSTQLAPRLLSYVDFGHDMPITTAWWIALIPSAWFAGFDDALAGSGARDSFVLAAAGLLATVAVLWLAFGRLAADYQRGLQRLGEASPVRRGQPGRRWIDLLVGTAPMRWWLRDSVERAAFLLTAAYLVRDRDVKLRVYPGLAPMLVMPIVLLLPTRHGGLGPDFGLAFIGCCLGLLPLQAVAALEYSQQWLAGDVFRSAPMAGPAPLCHGARRAVLVVLVIPAIVVAGAIALLLAPGVSSLPLLLPGFIAMPVYALVPALGGKSVPLSRSIDESKSANRGMYAIGATLSSFALAGVAILAQYQGWFLWLLLIESIVVLTLYSSMRTAIDAAVWEPLN